MSTKTKTSAKTSTKGKNQDENQMDKVLATFSTTSGKIRYLHSMGHATGEISRKLGIRYQWVRNVLKTEVKTPKEPLQGGKVGTDASEQG